MDFATLPPEINSGRIYAGPGSASMLAAAAAWDGLATDLRSMAAAFSSTIAGLMADWRGPSATAMAAAVEPYIGWLEATAEQAEQTGSGAKTAAAAYQTVLAAMVPPAGIAANRDLLAALTATNIVGQNTAAIAATEAAYGEMWEQDAAAMYVYAESSSTAAQLSDFEQPSPITRQPGSRAPDSGVPATAPTNTGANSTVSEPISAAPNPLQNAAAATAAAPTDADIAGIQNLAALVSQFQAVGVVSVIIGLGITAEDFSATLDAATATGAGSALAALPESATAATASVTQPTITAAAGEARVVSSLSVPPGWAAATPTVRLAAAALGGIGVPAAGVAASLDSAVGQMALASLAGSALGGATSANVMRPAAPKGQPVSDDDSETPEKLKRVLSQLAHEPESVQHWHTDKAHLDGLLEQLSSRPGIHTVHVSKKPRFTTKLSGPF